MSPAANPLLSVVVPTCNRNDDLGRCLERLRPACQGLPEAPDGGGANYEVIVTDDGTDGQAEGLLRARFPWARWTRGPRRGPAANRNHGSTEAQGSWLVFLDDDCVPERGYLAAYIRAIAEGDARVLEGRTVPDGRPGGVDMECPANETGGYLWSCNMAIAKDLFTQLEGFDPNFPGPAMEDVDLCTRLVKAGERIRFVPDAQVRHPWRRRKGFPFIRLHSASVVYFVSKHPERQPMLSVGVLAANLARKLFSHLPRQVRIRGIRGLGRELVLSTYATYALMVATQRGKRRSQASRRPLAGSTLQA